MAVALRSHLLFHQPRLLPSASITRRQLIGATSLSPLTGTKPAGHHLSKAYSPNDHGVVLLDIIFVPGDPSHGFLLGTRQTIFETKDGGNTWVSRSVPSAQDEDFNSISFIGKGGWIVGKRATLFYPPDAGNTWQRIPVRAQLPGNMHRLGGGGRNSYTEDRPRFFDSEVKKMCWEKAKQVPGRDPERWRIDAAGNVVCKRLHTCQGCLCFEYDHIIPFSRGGESVVDNCQILQTRVNRLKSDKNGIDQRSLNGYSCAIKFSDEQLDIIEMAIYGSVFRPGKQCIVGNVDTLLVKNKCRNHLITCDIHYD